MMWNRMAAALAWTLGGGVALAQSGDLDALATEAFVPGTYGEPFTLTGLLQGCELADGGETCTFYAEGWRWITSAGSATPPAAFRALAELPVNSPVAFSGDMLSQGDITVEIALSRLVPAWPDAYADLRAGMQGEWVDTTDPKSELLIHGSEETSVYDGEALGVAVITFGDRCPDDADATGPVVYKQMMGSNPADTLCYHVLDVTTDYMELSYAGRGNTLAFRRK